MTACRNTILNLESFLRQPNQIPLLNSEHVSVRRVNSSRSSFSPEALLSSNFLSKSFCCEKKSGLSIPVSSGFSSIFSSGTLGTDNVLPSNTHNSSDSECKPNRLACCVAKKQKVGGGRLISSKRSKEEKSPETIAWEKMVSELETSGKTKATLNKFNAKKRLVKSEMVGTIIRLKQLKKWRVLAEVIIWLQGQSWWEMSLKDYTILTLAYAKEGNVQKAFETFTVSIDSGFQPNVFLCSALLEAYVSKRMFQMSEQLIEKMRRENVKPTIQTYQILLRGYCQANMVEEATRLFETLRNAHDPDTLPDVQTYNTMMHMYSEIGDYEEASRIFRQIKAVGLSPNLVTFNIMIAMFAKEARSREAEGVFRQMQEMNLSPSIVTYTSLLTAYGRAGRAEEAQAVFQDIISSNLRPSTSTYNALLDAYGKAGEVENAEYVYKEMLRNKYKPTLETYTSLMDAYAQEGQLEKAEGILRAYVKEGNLPSVAMWHVLMDGYRLIDDIASIREKYDEMVASGVKPNLQVYTTMIVAYGSSGDFLSAFSMFEDMVKQGVTPDEGCKKALLNCCQDDSQGEKVQQMIEDIDSVKVGPSARVWNNDVDVEAEP